MWSYQQEGPGHLFDTVSFSLSLKIQFDARSKQMMIANTAQIMKNKNEIKTPIEHANLKD